MIDLIALEENIKFTKVLQKNYYPEKVTYDIDVPTLYNILY